MRKSAILLMDVLLLKYSADVTIPNRHQYIEDNICDFILNKLMILN